MRTRKALQVGRPRPSFFYRCWPDGKAAFTPGEAPDREPVCSPKDKHDVTDGYKSFPSGAAPTAAGDALYARSECTRRR